LTSSDDGREPRVDDSEEESDGHRARDSDVENIDSDLEKMMSSPIRLAKQLEQEVCRLLYMILFSQRIQIPVTSKQDDALQTRRSHSQSRRSRSQSRFQSRIPSGSNTAAKRTPIPDLADLSSDSEAPVHVRAKSKSVKLPRSPGKVKDFICKGL
jgi:hypothetical protein